MCATKAATTVSRLLAAAQAGDDDDEFCAFSVCGTHRLRQRAPIVSPHGAILLVLRLLVPVAVHAVDADDQVMD